VHGRQGLDIPGDGLQQQVQRSKWQALLSLHPGRAQHPETTLGGFGTDRTQQSRLPDADAALDQNGTSDNNPRR
jgi:hypothetical protein